MLCPACNNAIPEEAQFCPGCGVRLDEFCTQCQAPLLDEARFCHVCGAPRAASENLDTAIGANNGASAPGEPAPAERRQLTVMFVDLVDSTALSERLDAEDLRELLRDYQASCANVIARFDGYIARYMGDGILVYFGYPQAHEDDAARALLTALGIVAAIEKLDRSHTGTGISLGVRQGIATGQVIAGDLVGEGAAEEKAVIGETPNLAARLQSLAQPGTVLVSESTRKLVGNEFTFDLLEGLRLKGFSDPVNAYLVTGKSIPTGEVDQKTKHGPLTLIGRKSELSLLKNSWQQIQQGENEVVLLTAEGGIGKSRLTRAFGDFVDSARGMKWLYFCSPFHVNTSFYPVIEHLERAFRFNKGDATDRKYDKIADFIDKQDGILPEAIPLIASLFALPANARYPGQDLTPAEQKYQLMGTLAALVETTARKTPLLMIFEDAHWMDPTTCEFISLLIERVENLPVMILVTYRPEFDSPWANLPRSKLLKLNHLTRRESEAMILEITGALPLPENVLERILDKTDGVPLYIEEFTRALLESEQLERKQDRYELAGELSPMAVPSSLQDSLMSRLDRLSQAKELAQLASAIGRAFPYRLLALVCEKPERDLRRGVDELVEAEIFYRRGLEPDIRLEFKHALLQEAAYQSLLKSHRRQHHSRIAEIMRNDIPEYAQRRPQLIAHHYSEAGMPAEAHPFWLKAGQLAAAQFANFEAIAHFNRGLELIEELPESHERDLTELEFYLALGPTLMATRGFAVSEVESAYERSRDLSAKVGTDRQLFTATWGLWLYRQQHGQIDEARRLAGILQDMVSDEHDSGVHLQAHHAAWTTAFRIGDFSTCCRNAEAGIAIYERKAHADMAFAFGGHDAGVCGYYHAAQCRWMLGFPDQAIAHVEQMRLLAEKIDHPFTTASYLTFAAYTYQYVGDVAGARRLCEETQRVCAEYKVAPQYRLSTSVVLGWVLVQEGEVEEGLRMMREGLETISQSPTRAHEAYLLTLLAGSCLEHRLYDECSTILEMTLERIRNTGEVTWLAEVLRLDGILKNHLGAPPEQVEATFEQAAKIARDQHSRAFELRCAISRSTVIEADLRQAWIRENLLPLHRSFDEGFDSADLKKSTQLVAEIT